MTSKKAIAIVGIIAITITSMYMMLKDHRSFLPAEKIDSTNQSNDRAEPTPNEFMTEQTAITPSKSVRDTSPIATPIPATPTPIPKKSVIIGVTNLLNIVKEIVVDIITHDKTAKKPEVVTQPDSNKKSNQSGKEQTRDNQNSTTNNAAELPSNTQQPSTKPDSQPTSDNILSEAAEDKANSIARSEVKSEDILKAAAIVLGKLSLSDIKYLFDSARDDYWKVTPVEEIKKAREMLFAKLTEDDLEKLRQLGKKYGRGMTILDPDIDVEEVKAQHMRDYGE